MVARATESQQMSGKRTTALANGCSKSARAPIGSPILRFLLVLDTGVVNVLTDSGSRYTLPWAKEMQPAATPKGSRVRPSLVLPKEQARLARVEVARGLQTRDNIKAAVLGDCL